MLFIKRLWRVVGVSVVCIALLDGAPKVKALETDQYDLSPVPLADIGDEVSEHVEQKLRVAIDELNARIAKMDACLKLSLETAGKSCKPADARIALEYLRSGSAVAKQAYDALGAGTPPFSVTETWIEKHRFQNQPARYKVGFWKSLFIVWPVDAFTISPTVNLYGSEFGIDKFGHFFQQGYSYYKIYARAIAEGATPDEARQRAVGWGQKTENTIYGKMVTLAYSNGDLFANYAGMKFYQGLTDEIRIGSLTRPPTFLLKNGFWEYNGQVRTSGVLLKPLISDHLNEALNPSIFTQVLGLRWYVRRKVAGRSCPQWFNRYPSLSRAGIEETSHSLRSWHGEDYGFTNSENFITIANSCFDSNGTPRYRPEVARRLASGSNQSITQRN